MSAKREALAALIYSWRPKVIADHTLQLEQAVHNRAVTWAELNTQGAFGWEPAWAETCRRRADEALNLLGGSEPAGGEGAAP